MTNLTFGFLFNLPRQSTTTCPRVIFPWRSMVTYWFTLSRKMLSSMTPAMASWSQVQYIISLYDSAMATLTFSMSLMNWASGVGRFVNFSYHSWKEQVGCLAIIWCKSREPRYIWYMSLVSFIWWYNYVLNTCMDTCWPHLCCWLEYVFFNCQFS